MDSKFIAFRLNNNLDDLQIACLNTNLDRIGIFGENDTVYLSPQNIKTFYPPPWEEIMRQNRPFVTDTFFSNKGDFIFILFVNLICIYDTVAFGYVSAFDLEHFPSDILTHPTNNDVIISYSVGKIYIWDINACKCLKTIEDPFINAIINRIVFIGDGNVFLVTLQDNFITTDRTEYVKMISLQTGDTLHRMETCSKIPNYQSGDTILAANYDGSLFATARGFNYGNMAADNIPPSIILWFGFSHRQKSLRGQMGSISQLAFNHQGTRLVSSGNDTIFSLDINLMVWDTQSGQCIYKQPLKSLPRTLKILNPGFADHLLIKKRKSSTLIDIIYSMILSSKKSIGMDLPEDMWYHVFQFYRCNDKIVFANSHIINVLEMNF